MADTNDKPEETKIPEEFQNADAGKENITAVSAGTIQASEPKKDADDQTDKPEEKNDDTDATSGEDPKPEEGADADPKEAKAKADQKERDEWEAIPEGVRKRVSRSNRQAREAKEKNQKLEARIEELEANMPQKEIEKGKPEELSPDDFDSFDDYLDAQAKADKPKDVKPKPEAKPEAKAEEFIGTVPGVTFYEARGKLQDAVETADPNLWDEALAVEELQMSPELVVSLSETEKPVDILRALIADTSKAEAFSKLSPFAQARELAKMETNFTADTTQPKRKRTQAGEPIEGGKTRGGAVTKSHSEMSQDEFEAAREIESQNGKQFWL